MTRWMIISACVFAFGLALLLPTSRAWFAEQGAVIAEKSALDQLVLGIAACGLLGLSTLAASWRAIGKANIYNRMADEQAGLAAAQAKTLAAAQTDLAALKARDLQTLGLDAVGAGSQAGREAALKALQTGLPQAVSDLAALKRDLGDADGAARLEALANQLKGEAA